MTARATPTNLQRSRNPVWPFYVYELTNEAGEAVYVGKGSGARVKVSAYARGYPGREVARFKREKDAFAYEVARIAEYAPILNKHPGGNGSWVRKRRAPTPRLTGVFREIERIGTRAYAARLLLIHAPRHGFVLPDPEMVRRVAYG
jgi:hypothetical protein